MNKQLLIISTMTAVLSVAQANAGVLGGTLGGGLGGSLTGIGSASGMSSIGGTLERPGAIDRVSNVTGGVKDRGASVVEKAGDKAKSKVEDVKTTTEQAKPAESASAPATPSQSLDGNLGGALDSKYLGADGNSSGATQASREQGVTLDGQSSGNARVGKKAEPAATTTTAE